MNPTAFDSHLAALLPKLRDGYYRRDDRYVEELLAEAIRQSPQRLDFRHALANRHIQTEEPDLSLAIWEELHALVPRDPDTLVCLAHWRRHQGDLNASVAAWTRLAELMPERARRLQRLWQRIDDWLGRPIPVVPPVLPAGVLRPAIATLGFILNPDGSPAPELIRRLEKTREAAHAYPDASIVLTGGVPRNGQVEAVVMRQWLEKQGIPRQRLFEEGYARNVVENVLYTRQILDAAGADAVVAITGGRDIGRTGACFETVAAASASEWKTFALAADAWVEAGPEAARRGGRIKMYRDALRSDGLLLMGIFPQLVER